MLRRLGLHSFSAGPMAIYRALQGKVYTTTRPCFGFNWWTRVRRDEAYVKSLISLSVACALKLICLFESLEWVVHFTLSCGHVLEPFLNHGCLSSHHPNLSNWSPSGTWNSLLKPEPLSRQYSRQSSTARLLEMVGFSRSTEAKTDHSGCSIRLSGGLILQVVKPGRPHFSSSNVIDNF